MLGKIKFDLNHDIKQIRDIFENIIRCGQCDYSKVSVSFFFQEQNLLDKIFADTDIDYIEGMTWEELHNYEDIFPKDCLENILALQILSDKAEIVANFQECHSLPPFEQYACVWLRKSISDDWTLLEEEQKKSEIAELYSQVFGDISTLHLSSSFGGSSNTVSGFLRLTPNLILEGIPKLLEYLSPSSIRVGYKVAIDRQSRNCMSAEFSQKFLKKPKGIYINNWNFDTPFAVNSNGTFYPVNNCSFEAAFELAAYAQKNISLFHRFAIFRSRIPWRYENGVTTDNSVNAVDMRIYKNGIYLYANYERYEDCDPLPKAIRNPINAQLAKYNITLKSAETVKVSRQEYADS